MLVNPEMYEENSPACFDPTSMQEGLAEDGYSQNTQVPNCNFSMEEQLSYHQNHTQQDSASVVAAAMEMELQQQLSLEMEHCYNNNHNNPHQMDNNNNNNTHLMQDVNHNPNWDYYQQDHSVEIQNGTQYPPTPDLLNLFHLPRCSASTLLPNSSISFANPTHDSGPNVLYDPLYHLNLPPQPPLFRDLFQSLPHGYSLSGSRSGASLFGGVEEREIGNGGGYGDGDGDGDGDGVQFENGVFEFTSEMNCGGRGRGDGKDTKHFATERQRRVHLNDKYKALKNLVPNPTKPDRASIVGDAIQYIEELKRTVNELRILVENKRCSRERIKRTKTEDDSVDTMDIKPHGDMDQTYNVSSSSLRIAWLQRKSKNTEVEVRIIHDEATIKLVQQKRTNCLLCVSKVLDELQLDLHHVAGGLIGDFYSFLFNTKIYEGSSVYASAIANKLIEVVDRQYAATPPTSSY